MGSVGLVTPELVSQVLLPMLRLPQVVLSLLGLGSASQMEMGISIGLVTATTNAAPVCLVSAPSKL